ncbi:hypothetical protein BDP27DRAFT_1328770 [Rhodocollybia butyracea]|uniref:DUF6699 domain-containing protein n=1 Tax=Rhodocollybia butyracea TaxID=206335 RepID=A0A9P5PQI3_9AGAR|nr:hypothetical protein BDP27DRAFT_1328770 [Rhodocollybia butyracea]
MRERFVLPAPESYNNEQHCSQSQTRGRGSRSTFSDRKTACHQRVLPQLADYSSASSLNLASSPSNYTHGSSASFIPPPAPPPTKRPRQPGHTPTKLHFHSLFAPTPAPILYDVILPPSRNSVRSCIDASTNASSSSSSSKKPSSDPVPTHTLSQPATDPPTYGTLKLYCERFPWVITACDGCASSPASNGDREIVACLCSNLSLHAPRPKSKVIFLQSM